MNRYFDCLSADGARDQLVVVDGQKQQRLTVDAFWRRTEGLAAALSMRGIGAGAIVLIFAQNSADALHAFFACQRLGAIPSYMPPPSPRQAVEPYMRAHRQVCERIAPKLILLNGAAAEGLRGVFPVPTASIRELDEMEPATIGPYPGEAQVGLLQHSSGTTGLKKGIPLDYNQLVEQVNAYGAALKLKPDTTVVSWLPLYHDMGLIACTILPVVLRQKLVLMDTFAWLADPLSILRLAADEPSAVLWLPNFAFNYLANHARRLKQPLDLSNLHAVVNCSEPCKPSSMDRFIRAFAPHRLRPEAVQVSYALAENVFAATQTPIGQRVRALTVDQAAFDTGTVRPIGRRAMGEPPIEAGSLSLEFASCGPFIEGTEAEIRRADGSPVGKDEVGRIWLRGRCVFRGYHKAPELTAERFKDGWFNTNDLGFIDDGELYVCGRVDDLIIVNGKNLLAHDLEASCSDVRGVKAGRCSAFGSYDDRAGSQSLVIVAETEITSDAPDLQTAINQAIMDEFGLYPGHVLLVPIDTLVKTTSGKMSRSENKKLYLEGALRSWSPADGGEA
ncbi:MAG: AMP-binding protein [Pseudomonadota bacterium]